MVEFTIGILCGFLFGQILMFFAADVWIRTLSRSVTNAFEDAQILAKENADLWMENFDLRKKLYGEADNTTIID